MLVLIATLGVGSVVVAINRGTSSNEWSWRAGGVLGRQTTCSRQGRAQSPATCQFQVANPPVLSGEIRLEVRVHNGDRSAHCYGLSITTSYLAGLQDFCAKAGGYGHYVTMSPARFYVDFELDLFVSVNEKGQPLSPVPSTSRSRFDIVFSEARR